MKKFIIVLCVALAFCGCAQMNKITTDNPELVVKVNDLISDIVKIAGSELIAQMTKSEDVQAYLYTGTKLKQITGQPVKQLIVKDGCVITVW